MFEPTQVETPEQMIEGIKKTLDGGSPLSHEDLAIYAEVIRNEPQLLQEPSSDQSWVLADEYQKRHQIAVQNPTNSELRALQRVTMGFLKSRISEIEEYQDFLSEGGIRRIREMHIQSLKTTLGFVSK
jgi:hypothetical protein